MKAGVQFAVEPIAETETLTVGRNHRGGHIKVPAPSSPYEIQLAEHAARRDADLAWMRRRT